MNRTQESDDETLDAADRYRTARAYGLILGMLSRHHGVTAKDAQSRLEAAGWSYDVRTVQGLLKSLAEGDADIERDASGKPHRYRWHRTAPNPWNPEFSDREALMLLLAVEHLRQLVPSDVLQWLDGRLQEARRRLDPESEARKAARSGFSRRHAGALDARRALHRQGSSAHCLPHPLARANLAGLKVAVGTWPTRQRGLWLRAASARAGHSMNFDCSGTGGASGF